MEWVQYFCKKGNCVAFMFILCRRRDVIGMSYNTGLQGKLIYGNCGDGNHFIKNHTFYPVLLCTFLFFFAKIPFLLILTCGIITMYFYAL